MANAFDIPVPQSKSHPVDQAEIRRMVREAAEKIPQVQKAYVRPDGLELVMYGEGHHMAAYLAASHVVSTLQNRYWPHEEDPIVEGGYSAYLGEPESDWVLVYQR